MNVMCMIGNMALIGAEKTGHLLGNVKNALKGNLCLGKVMNNFTKEELEEIMRGLSEFLRLNPETEDLYNAREKIHSMIDNYCEHVNTSCDCDCGSRCDDCGKCVAWNDKNENQ